MISVGNAALALSLIAIILGAGGLAYSASLIGGSIESVKASVKGDISGMESKLTAKIDSASKQVESIAKATGVPLGNPEELARVLAMQELIEAARKEGRVTFYTAHDIALTRPMVNAFERKYPFIKVELWRGAATPLIDKVRSETTAGIYSVDVIQGTELTHKVFRDTGLLQPYTPPEFAQNIPKEFKLTDDTYRVLFAAVALGYNTKKVKPAELPKTWFEVTDPKWKDKFGMGDPMVHVTSAELMVYMEKSLGPRFLDWIKGLRALNPKLYVSLAPSAGAACKGEVDVAFAFAHVTNACKLAGDASDIHFINPTPATFEVVALARRAPNPNAGKLFINFIFSVEGQRALADVGDVVVRPGIPLVTPFPKDLKLEAFGGNSPDEIKVIRDKIKPIWTG